MTTLALVVGSLLVAAAIYLHVTGAPGIVGPLAGLELRKAGRLWYVRWATVLFAAVVGCIVLGMYLDHVVVQRFTPAGGPRPGYLGPLMLVAWGQLLAWTTAVLATVWVAWPIARWKEQRSLELLLTTDLRAREIVGGLTFGRAAVPLRLLLAGLPVGLACYFLTGIDLELLLAVVAAILVTVLSLSAIATACAVVSRRPVGAVLLAWAVAGGYLLGTGVLSTIRVGSTSYHAVTLFDTTVSVGDAADVLSAGNPFVVAEILYWDKGWRTAVPWRLAAYLWHHLILTVVFFAFAAWRLRPAVAGGGERRLSGGWLSRRRLRRPPVSDEPVRWKEVHVDRGLRLPWYGKLVVLGVAVLSFAPLWPILVEAPHYRGGVTELRTTVMIWSRVMGSLVAIALSFGVIFRAALTVAEERNRDTFVSLALTPLTAAEILWGKWWGCLAGLKWGWVWLGLVWLPGVVAGGPISIALGPLLVVAVASWAALAAWFGLYVATLGRPGWQSLVVAAFLWPLSAAVPGVAAGLAGYIGERMRAEETGYGIAAALAGMSWPAGLAALPPTDYQALGAGDDFTLIALLMAAWALASLVPCWFLTRHFARRAVARFDRLRMATQ